VQTLRGHEHVVEAVSMGSVHFSALVELMGGVATATAAVGGTEGGMGAPVEKVCTLLSLSHDYYFST
jgi:hypothetical protein